MHLFVKDFETRIRFPVLDEIVDGERHALDRVLQVRVRDGGVVDVDGRTRARLLQDSELAHGH